VKYITSPIITSAVLAAALTGLSACSNSSGPEEPAWQIVWQDEFNGPAGQQPDSTRWGYDIGTDWGNAQLEYDTDRPQNASLDGNGNLAITALEESYLGRNYTSARINTRDLFEPTLGRIEARMQLPWGQGIWPAFWLLGANFDSVGWPMCGEIDIMEYRGQEPITIHGSVHGPGYSGGAAVTNQYDLVGGRFDTEFHVFAVEWRAQEIKWFVDNNLYHTVTPSNVSGAWVFEHPSYIILNLAVGGNYVGPPNTSTTFPQTLLIDWVRVYRESS
jgi:beta-glucanase (GH16 family)